MQQRADMVGLIIKSILAEPLKKHWSKQITVWSLSTKLTTINNHIRKYPLKAGYYQFFTVLRIRYLQWLGAK